MAQELSVQEKRRGRPPGKVKPETVATRIFAETFAEVDAWIGRQPDPKPSRPEAVRELVRRGLAR